MQEITFQAWKLVRDEWLNWGEYDDYEPELLSEGHKTPEAALASFPKGDAGEVYRYGIIPVVTPL
jgi:hypothetical protein